MLKKRIWNVGTGCLLCMLCFCHCRNQDNQRSLSAQQQADSLKKNAVILKIGNTEYRNAELERYLQIMVGEDHTDLSSLSLSRIFDNFIDEKILLEAAREKEMSLSSEEKKKYLMGIKDDMPGQEKEFSLSEKQMIYEDLLIEKYTSDLVKDMEVQKEEIEQYYEENKREFLCPERVEVSQILLKTEDKAIEVREQLKKSTGENFRRLARDISKGAEASRGGKMGVFEMGQLPFEMEKVVFSLEEKEISPVVESIYGFHIFRVDKKYPPALVPQQEAKASIELILMEKKIKKIVSQHVQTLKKEMDWEYYPDQLTFPYQRTHS